MTLQHLIDRLDRVEHASSALAAFDGDGTLWSGDVSDDVFEAACARGFLRTEARPPLVAAARDAGLATHGTASELAWRLFVAYREGGVPERQMFELMTVCYAGCEEAELTEFAALVLQAKDLMARPRAEVVTLLRRLRERGLVCLLVTASPRAIVNVPASLLGFVPELVIAASNATASGKLLARLAAPVPYAEEKPAQVRRLFPKHRWLVSLGDSPFDLPMLFAAEHAVVVGERLARSAEAAEHPHLVALALGPSPS